MPHCGPVEVSASCWKLGGGPQFVDFVRSSSQPEADRPLLWRKLDDSSPKASNEGDPPASSAADKQDDPHQIEPSLSHKLRVASRSHPLSGMLEMPIAQICIKGTGPPKVSLALWDLPGDGRKCA